MDYQIKIFLLLASVVTMISAQRFIYGEVKCNQKREIVNIHNVIRQKLASGKFPRQPKASNMQKLVWDDKLAILAQNWANKMRFGHSSNRRDSRFSVGENIFTSSSTSSNKTPNWSQALKSWYGEHSKYRYGPLRSSSGTGHYTQFVWADTTHVGCGFSFYKNNNGFYTKLYVCNYGPAGNFLGRSPYKKGRGCENLCCSKNRCRQLYGNKCK